MSLMNSKCMMLLGTAVPEQQQALNSPMQVTGFKQQSWFKITLFRLFEVILQICEYINWLLKIQQ